MPRILQPLSPQLLEIWRRLPVFWNLVLRKLLLSYQQEHSLDFSSKNEIGFIIFLAKSSNLTCIWKFRKTVTRTESAIWSHLGLHLSQLEWKKPLESHSQTFLHSDSNLSYLFFWQLLETCKSALREHWIHVKYVHASFLVCWERKG